MKETQQDYDDDGNVIEIRKHNGDILKFTYERRLNPYDSRFFYTVKTSATDRFGRTTRYEWLQNGKTRNTIFTTAEYGDVVNETRYDDKGRLEVSIDPLGFETKHTYGGDGNVKTTELPKVAGKPDAIETLEYDPAGNIKARIDAEGHRTESEFDPLNRLKKRTEPGNVTRTFVYDAAGNARVITDRNGKISTLRYTLLDQVRETVDPTG